MRSFVACGVPKKWLCALHRGRSLHHSDVVDGQRHASVNPDVGDSRRAWIALIVTPIGLLIGVILAYGVAAALGLTLDPATAEQPRVSDKAIVYGAASLVWLAPPIAAVALAIGPTRSGNRAGLVAVILGSVVTMGLTAMTFVNILGA